MPQKPLTASDLVDKAAGAGLEVVQIADNLPLEKLALTELEGLHKYAISKNVSVEMGGRGLDPEHTMKCLQTAEILHSPILRMVIDSTGFEPDIKTIVSVIRELEPEFDSRGIKLAIENHDRFKASEFAEIIEASASRSVGICLDSVNSMGAGEGFTTVAGILIPYTINLHIKDFVIFRAQHKMGFTIEGRPAGKGMLNIPELVSRVQETGRCRSAILELWTPPEADIDSTIRKESAWAEESVGYLKTVVGP
jgi:sugar phosphate isomerase/epimerase